MRDIQWIRQTKNTCGQTCIAMLAGITLEEAIEVVGKKGCTSTRHIVQALKALGFKPKSTKLIRRKKGEKLPRNCIVKVCWYKDGRRLNKSHWILKWNNRHYDPSRERFQTPGNGKFTSYLPIENTDE